MRQLLGSDRLFFGERGNQAARKERVTSKSMLGIAQPEDSEVLRDSTTF
jgi:hypothetical protein